MSCRASETQETSDRTNPIRSGMFSSSRSGQRTDRWNDVVSCKFCVDESIQIDLVLTSPYQPRFGESCDHRNEWKYAVLKAVRVIRSNKRNTNDDSNPILPTNLNLTTVQYRENWQPQIKSGHTTFALVARWMTSVFESTNRTNMPLPNCRR